MSAVMLIRRLFYMCFKRETEYKLNFILLCVSVAPLRLMFLLFALVLSSKIEVLYGWNAWDIAFLYGMYVVSYSLAQIFFKPFRNLDKLITHGELDKFFTKPQPVLFSLIFYNIHIMEIFSQLVPSLIILILACFQVSARWNLFKVLILTAGIAGGTLIQAGIFVFIGCTSIFMFNSSWLGDLYYAFRDFLSYPLVIFGKKMLLFLTCVLPLAFVNYYPARYILEKENKDALINFITLPVSLVISVLIYKLWKISCRHYASSGS